MSIRTIHNIQKDLPVGSTFKFQDKTFKVVEESIKNCCPDCYFFFNENIEHSCIELCEMGLIPECADIKREDRKAVIFLKRGE